MVSDVCFSKVILEISFSLAASGRKASTAFPLDELLNGSISPIPTDILVSTDPLTSIATQCLPLNRANIVVLPVSWWSSSR